MNDNNPLAVGDRVRHRNQPWVLGTVWALETGMRDDGRIVVDWDNRDDNAFIDPQQVENTPRRGA
jgi:hypothetical protein